MDVAEQPRVRRAGQHARGLPVRFGQRLVVDAVDAQRALGHLLPLLVELAHAVRARPRAVLAADALVVVDQHDAVLRALVARTGRADGHARRILAVQARLRKVHRLRVGELADLEGLHAVEEGAGRIRVVRAARPRAVPALPDVFHSLQLVTQAWQPTHTLRSITRASWVICFQLRPFAASRTESRCHSASRTRVRRRAAGRTARTAATSPAARRRRPCRCARARRTTPPGP